MPCHQIQHQIHFSVATLSTCWVPWEEISKTLVESYSSVVEIFWSMSFAIQLFVTAGDMNAKEETPSSPVPFDLVILLEGCNIHSGDIKEVIQNNIRPFGKSKETMRLLEDPKIQERTLILLDGFDEIQNPEKKLLPILSGNYKRHFICDVSSIYISS